MAIAAGLGVAFAGAAIWALLVTKTGREFGWLSWGIGAAIGTSMLKLGARGPGAALIALLVTAAGLLGGRFASLTLLRDRIAHQILEGELEQELESRARVAEQIAALDRPISDATLEQLNYEHYLVELEGPNPTAAEFDAIREALDDFEAFAEPQAREELMQSAKAEMRATLPMSSLFRYSLTPMGVIFATLGLITALTMVLRAR